MKKKIAKLAKNLDRKRISSSCGNCGNCGFRNYALKLTFKFKLIQAIPKEKDFHIYF